jgi:hypothetical protein
MKLSIGDYVRWRMTGKVAKIVKISTVDLVESEWPPETVFYHLEVHPDDNPADVQKLVVLEPASVADNAPPDDPYGFDKIIL